MPTTILGSTGNPIPYPTYPVVVEAKAAWGDDWTVMPGLELEHATINAGGHDLDSCQIKHRYGYLRRPGETAFHDEGRLTLDGCWVRVSLALTGGNQPFWIGRIYNDPRTIYGAPTIATGHQTLQCYGAQMLLRKRSVSESVWQPPTGASFPAGVNRVQWIAPLNDRIGHHGWVIGNRSTDVDEGSGTYLFGGTQAWNYRQYLEYVLYWFMVETGGPTWTLTGQADLLESITLCHTWPETVTVDRILQTLITPKYGVDFKVIPTDTGFSIFVFALQSADVTSNGVTLPANPNVVEVQAGTSPANLSTTVTRNSDHMFGKIRVLGKRIVVCGTLVGQDVDDDSAGSLMPAWNSDLQSEYVAGVGPVPGGDPSTDYPIGSEERADYCRKQHRYRDVFQLYLMPPAKDLKALGLLYMTDSTGTLVTSAGGGYDPPWQSRIRKTLHWLPLLVGWDYTTSLPTNLFPIDDDVDYVPQYVPPAVWLWSDIEGYVPADSVGVSVSVPKMGLGVRLHSEPKHLIALGTTIPKTLVAPKYSMRRAFATVAFEADCRLHLEHTIDGATPGVDGVEEIVANDAELWLLAPKTVLDVDPSDSNGVKTSGDTVRILRNDKDRLAMLMAGAIARYATQRARAEIVVAGLMPWGELLGQILAVVDTGDAGERIDTPITTITWTVNESSLQTVVSTGFARSE